MTVHLAKGRARATTMHVCNLTRISTLAFCQWSRACLRIVCARAMIERADVRVMTMVMVMWERWVRRMMRVREALIVCCERSRLRSMKRWFGGLKGHLAFRRKKNVLRSDAFDSAERLRLGLLRFVLGVWRKCRGGGGRMWRMGKMLKG